MESRFNREMDSVLTNRGTKSFPENKREMFQPHKWALKYADKRIEKS